MYVIKPKQELNKGRLGHLGRVRNMGKGSDMAMSMENMQNTRDKGREWWRGKWALDHEEPPMSD